MGKAKKRVRLLRNALATPNDNLGAMSKIDSAGPTPASTKKVSHANNAFARLKLHAATQQAIKELGFAHQTSVQQACLPLLIYQHRDLVVQAPTGSGKTLAFVIPIFELLHRYHDQQLAAGATTSHPILACVICPTQELAQQIYDVVMQFQRCFPKLHAAMWIGGHNINEEIENFIKHGASIIVATPGRIQDLLTRTDEVGTQIRAGMKFLEVLVFDEADRLLDMGFRPAIDVVLAAVPKQRRTALFSATQTKSVDDLVRFGMRNPAVVKVNLQGCETLTSLSAKELENSTSTPAQLENFYKITSPYEKVATLFEFLCSRKSEKHLVFVPTCAVATYLALLVRDATGGKIPVFELHRKLKHKRKQIFKEFSQVKFGILIATDIVARGIDWPDISWVIQLDVPKTPSSFVHRCGRTARLGGLVGSTMLFLMPNEEGYVNFIEKNQNVQLKEASWLELPNAPRIAEVLKRFRKTVAEDRLAYDASIMAFTSYVRAYGKHECALLCQVKELDLVSLAIGMGLISLPTMPELRGRDTTDFTNITKNVNVDEIKFKDKQKQRGFEQRKANAENPPKIDEAENSDSDDDSETMPTDVAVHKNLGKRRWNESWSQSHDKRERRKERKLIQKLKSSKNMTKVNMNGKRRHTVDINVGSDDDDDEETLATRIVEIKNKRQEFLRATKPERMRKQARMKQDLLMNP